MKKQNRKVAEGLSLSHLPKGLPVVVTGATGGIGAEICRALGLLGVPVVMACRSEKKFAETYERLLKEVPEMKAEFLPLDLTDHASVTGAVDRLHLRHIAGVINNAGTMQRHFTQTAEGVETTMAVNYYNTKLFNQLLLPQIAEGGVMVFTTSLTRRGWSHHRMPVTVTAENFGQLKTYSLSKARITQFAKEFMAECGSHGVRVNCADPGVVDSSMIRMDRWFDPIADIIFRPLIRTPRNGAVPAIRALLSSEGGKIFTLRKAMDI